MDAAGPVPEGPLTTSRAAVRTAIAQYFGGSTYDTLSRSYRGSGPLLSSGLSTVRAYQSKRTSDHDYTLGQAAGRGMGAYMIVYMPRDTEIRRTMPSGTGRKRITYLVLLETFHLAHANYAEDAEADVDALAEAVKGLIQADVTLGARTSAGVYRAGEDPSGIVTTIDPSGLMKNDITATHFQTRFNAEVEIVA